MLEVRVVFTFVVEDRANDLEKLQVEHLFTELVQLGFVYM